MEGAFFAYYAFRMYNRKQGAFSLEKWQKWVKNMLEKWQNVRKKCWKNGYVDVTIKTKAQWTKTFSRKSTHSLPA